MPSSFRPLLILRHGESEWNRAGRWQGWEDIDLTAMGEKQALARAELLAGRHHGITAAVASDLRRAHRTAEILAAHLGLPLPRTDAGFRERNGGQWQGHTRAEIEERWPGQLDSWRHGHITHPPGGESDIDVWARFSSALARHHERVPDGALLIVTHGGSLRLAAQHAGIELPPIVPNVGGWWFEYDGATLVGGAMVPELPAISTESDATE